MEMFQAFIEAAQRAATGGLVNASVKQLEADYSAVNKLAEFVKLTTSRQDEQLIEIRKVKGEDYAKSVKFHRKPREASKSDPLAEMLASLTTEESE